MKLKNHETDLGLDELSLVELIANRLHDNRSLDLTRQTAVAIGKILSSSIASSVNIATSSSRITTSMNSIATPINSYVIRWHCYAI